MLLNDIDDVIASYHRCMHSGKFVDTFYDIFLSTSPEVAHKFRRTDFDHQKLMLRQSLLLMLMFNNSNENVREELEKLGDRHSRQGVDIPPHLYALWLNSLCQAVEQHDPKYTPRIGELWRTAMIPGIELLISRY